MMKYWRIMILLVTVLGAILAMGFKVYPYGRNGVEVVYVPDDSPVSGVIEQGMIITAVNGKQVWGVEDWNQKIQNLETTYYITANGREYRFDSVEPIGIDVIEMERTNLDFGLDLRGGTRIILKPKEENATKETIDQVIATLETRANLYGLREINIISVGGSEGYYIQIEAAGLGKDIVDNLLSKQGKFEAKIVKPVALVTENNITKGNLLFPEKKYEVTVLDNDTIRIGNETVEPNSSISLEGINFQYINITQGKIIFLGDAYSGKDVEFVFTDPQRSWVIPEGNGYRFVFVIQVSNEGAQRFAEITYGIPKYMDINSGEEYLESEILLYLDGNLVSNLRISADLGGEVVYSPSIVGFRETRNEATAEKLRMQTILRSGALPTNLETASVDVLSPTLGKDFFQSAIYAAMFAAVAVVVVVFIRYRSLRLSIPMIFVGMSEVLIILGIASTNDSAIWSAVLLINIVIISLAWVKKEEIDIYALVGAILIPLLGFASWTIDLPVLGGIIAALGTSVDHQIIILDESRRGGIERMVMGLRDKIRRAFFIIFGAAATTTAAMLPLMFLGIGLIRGFAITTIIGVLVGILITRPAYARIVELVTK